MKIRHAILAVTLALAGCGSASPYPVPPPLPPEQRPLPPVSDQTLIWRPGDWVYTGGSYRYEPGGYVPASGHGGTWMFGHWSGPRDQTVWLPGGWL